MVRAKTQNKLMKRIIAALSLALLLSPTLPAAELTPEDRESGVKYLEKTRDELIAATKGLSTEQWNFKAGTNRWSIAEIVEHLASTEEMLLQRVQNEVMNAPARAEGEDVKALDEFVRTAIVDRSRKSQAPEPLVPKGRYGSPSDALQQFKANREKTLDYLKKTPGLRDHAADSPLGKKLDGYQWLIFNSAHTERHLRQLDEVKASTDFPKK